jgi:hypothetical protein
VNTGPAAPVETGPLAWRSWTSTGGVGGRPLPRRGRLLLRDWCGTGVASCRFRRGETQAAFNRSANQCRSGREGAAVGAPSSARTAAASHWLSGSRPAHPARDPDLPSDRGCAPALTDQRGKQLRVLVCAGSVHEPQVGLAGPQQAVADGAAPTGTVQVGDSVAGIAGRDHDDVVSVSLDPGEEA